MPSLLGALVIVCIAASSVAAGPDRFLKKGDCVRIKSPAEEGIFVLVDLGPDVFLIRDRRGAYPRKILVADISSLAVAVPKTRGEGSAHGALLGASVGLVSGALFGFALGDDPVDEHDSSGGPTERTLAAGKALYYGALFLAGGAIVGGVVGSMNPGERREPIPLNGKLDAGMARDGAVRVGIVFPVAWGTGE
jgi:hypothetical protein